MEGPCLLSFYPTHLACPIASACGVLEFKQRIHRAALYEIGRQLLIALGNPGDFEFLKAASFQLKDDSNGRPSSMGHSMHRRGYANPGLRAKVLWQFQQRSKDETRLHHGYAQEQQLQRQPFD